HGKPKAQWVFQEDNPDAVSGVTYNYSQYIDPGTGKNRLLSRVDVIRPNGSIANAEIGKEMDFYTDSRDNASYNISANGQGNLDAFIMAIFPGIVPSWWPEVAVEKTEFGSAVSNKVIYRYGLIRAVTVFDHGAKVSTENKLYDSETGEVLLTKTTNEFN